MLKHSKVLAQTDRDKQTETDRQTDRHRHTYRQYENITFPHMQPVTNGKFLTELIVVVHWTRELCMTRLYCGMYVPLSDDKHRKV